MIIATMTQAATAAYQMYAQEFGEAAARRNQSGRVAKLASVFLQIGSTDKITLHEESGIYFRDKRYRQIANADDKTVLGTTTENSNGRMRIVYAQHPELSRETPDTY